MVKKSMIFILVKISFMFLLKSGNAQTLDFNGLISSSVLYTHTNSFFYSNIRYLSKVALSFHLRNDNMIDALVSLDINSSFRKNSQENSFKNSNNTDMYRFQLRFSSVNYEARIGLQRINFGPGVLIRPLMWFERLDPRDPLQLTKGVYGALFRYYLKNNSNVWLWGLLGNKDTKGWELFPSNDKRPEFGGRVELSFPKGEIGFSVHNRKINIQEQKNEQFFLPSAVNKSNFDETKIGSDIRFDLGVGLWSEMCVVHKNIPDSMLEFQKMISVGMDYTFSIGNGIYCAGEYFFQSFSEYFVKNSYSNKLIALTANYPVSMINSVSTIIFYNQTGNNWYRFFQWKMSYDKFEIFLIGFFNSGDLPISNSAYQTFLGNGFEITFLYNH